MYTDELLRAWRGKQKRKKIIKNVRNLFELKKENEAIKYRIIGVIKSLFEREEEEDCYKPVRVGSF